MAETVSPSAITTMLVPISPDGGWGWVVVAGTFFVHVFADGFVYSLGVLVDALITEFNSDNTVAAMIISMLTGLTLGCGPLASAICNKFGCRVTTIIGAIISMTGCAASYFAAEMWHIIISVGVVMGVGCGLMYCPAIIAVTMYFEKRRSLATGIAVTGAGVGTVVFSTINEFVISSYGWRAVFLVFVGAFALCIVCGSTFRPLPFQEVSDGTEADDVFVAKKPDDENEAPLLAGNEPHSACAQVVPRSLSEPSGSACSGLRRRRSESIAEREVGYLNRKDVFYTGAITDVPEFRQDPDKYRSTGSLRRGSTSTTATLETLHEIREAGGDEPKEVDADNATGSNMRQTIAKMMSLSLLLDPVYLLFAAANLLTSVGFNSPLYFLPLHAVKGVGLDAATASRLLSVFGICNTLGRIFFGVVADRKLPLPRGFGGDVARNRLWMYNLTLTLCGLLTTFSFLCSDFITLAIYSGSFGFLISAYICLTSVVLVDLLGLAKLTNAFGLLLLWQGVGTVAGPPISGFFADVTHAYVLSFVFCGLCLMISGLMLFVIPFIQKGQSKVVSPGNGR